MKRWWMAVALGAAGCGAESADVAVQAAELRVHRTEGDVWTVRVLGGAGGRYDLEARGARFELEVLDGETSTIHELRDGDGALVALAETAADGSATLMNAEGEQVFATPDVEPLRDDDVAALFPAAVPVLLGWDFLEQLDGLDGALGVSRAPLRAGGYGNTCVNECTNARLSLRCCCGQGYECIVTATDCTCRPATELSGGYFTAIR
jgi:hypothetical protein